jgi:hypothetical protein
MKGYPRFTWVAIRGQRVQHCHFNGGMRGTVCNGVMLADTRHWLKYYPQPFARCKRCIAFLQRAVSCKGFFPCQMRFEKVKRKKK